MFEPQKQGLFLGYASTRKHVHRLVQSWHFDWPRRPHASNYIWRKTGTSTDQRSKWGKVIRVMSCVFGTQSLKGGRHCISSCLQYCKLDINIICTRPNVLRRSAQAESSRLRLSPPTVRMNHNHDTFLSGPHLSLSSIDLYSIACWPMALLHHFHPRQMFFKFFLIK